MRIARITIKGESGYGSIEDAFHDKITITSDSIQYEYNPLMASEKNATQKWSYRTISAVFRELFDELALQIPRIMARDAGFEVTDIGATTFIITYDDRTREERTFCLPGDEFKDAFSVIRQMIPRCETTPALLWMSNDSTEEE